MVFRSPCSQFHNFPTLNALVFPTESARSSAFDEARPLDFHDKSGTLPDLLRLFAGVSNNSRARPGSTRTEPGRELSDLMWAALHKFEVSEV